MEVVYYEGSNAHGYLQEVGMLDQQDQQCTVPTHSLSNQLDFEYQQEEDECAQTQVQKQARKGLFLYNIRFHLLQIVMQHHLIVGLMAIGMGLLISVLGTVRWEQLLVSFIIAVAILSQYHIVQVECQYQRKYGNPRDHTSKSRKHNDHISQFNPVNSMGYQNPCKEQEPLFINDDRKYEDGIEIQVDEGSSAYRLIELLGRWRQLLAEMSTNQMDGSIPIIGSNIAQICASYSTCGSLLAESGATSQQDEPTDGVAIHRNLGLLRHGVMESYRSLLVRLPSPDQTYDAYHKLEQMVKIVKAIPKVVKYNMWEMRASRAYQRLEEYYYICSCEYQHPSNNRECVYSQSLHEYSNSNKMMTDQLTTCICSDAQSDLQNRQLNTYALLMIIKWQLTHKLSYIRSTATHNNKQQQPPTDQDSINSISIELDADSSGSRIYPYLQISTDGTLRQIQEHQVDNQIEQLKAKLDTIVTVRNQQLRQPIDGHRSNTHKQEALVVNQWQVSQSKLLQRRVQGFGNLFKLVTQTTNPMQLYYIQ